jgi:hypothetical protein
MIECPHGRTGEEAAWCLDCESEAVSERARHPLRPGGWQPLPGPIPAHIEPPTTPGVGRGPAETEIGRLRSELMSRPTRAEYDGCVGLLDASRREVTKLDAVIRDQAARWRRERAGRRKLIRLAWKWRRAALSRATGEPHHE